MQLREAAERAEHDAKARAVVIRGEGPAFLAGGDVSLFHANLSRMPDLVRENAPELHRAILALRRAPKPVLASVHGAVAGAGMSVMAAADLAIAAADTKFTMAYSRLGTSPDGGATWSLPRLVGCARRWSCSCSRTPSTRVRRSRSGWSIGWWRPGGSKRKRRASRSAWRKAPTAAFAEIKRLVNQTYDQTLAAQLNAEVEAFARCAGTRDFAEGVTAFVEKRKSKFKGE